MEKNKRNIQADRKKTEVIGIAGSGRGVGTTHFSILMANYMTGVLRQQTAVLEWNQSKTFEHMEQVCVSGTSARKKNQIFKVLDVCYLKNAGKQELLYCLNEGFHTIIIDFGSDLQDSESEFFRCDRKLLIGSFTEWQLHGLIAMIAKRNRKEASLEYFAFFGSKETEREVRKQFQIQIRRIPYLPDAFTITGEAMTFLGEFLKD